MRYARCLIFVAIASMGSALLLSDIQSEASTRKARALKSKRTTDYAVSQIRPAPSRKARKTLSRFDRLDAPARIHRVKRTATRVSKKSIAEALIEPPSPETIDVLYEYGVPFIDGVPSIVILFPKMEKDDLPMGF